MQIDFTSPEFRIDPYPTYAALREHSPIFFLEEWNKWFVSGYEDCKAILRDPQMGVWHPGKADGAEELYTLTSLMLPFMDPPDHTRLRRLLLKAFTPKTVEGMRAKLVALVDSLLDNVIEAGQQNGPVDLLQTFALPLPAIVIAEMLGVPSQDHMLFPDWSKTLMLGLDLNSDPEEYAKAPAAAKEFMAYVAQLAQARRERPQDDLMSALVHVHDEGDQLSQDELYATCAGLLIGGHETTVHLICNTVIALQNHPDQAELLRNNPALGASATEEFLRYDTPFQMTSRLAFEPMEYKGHRFEPDQDIYLLIGAANRDEAQFPQADKLDITRDPNPHLSFSGGIHYCLGAPLARLEAEIAIPRLLERLPNLTVASDELAYRTSIMLRGVTELPITY